jgi:hypothetical protein
MNNNKKVDRRIENKLCKCGCGKIIPFFKTQKYKMPNYISGHNNKNKKLSEETIRKRTESFKKNWNLEKSQKRSEISKKLWQNEDSRKNLIEKLALRDMRKEKNPFWKGDKVSYVGLHGWVRANKPKDMFCSKCGKVTDDLELANISGEYKRDILDYRWLCVRCHKYHDFPDGRIGRHASKNRESQMYKKFNKKTLKKIN